MRKPWNKSHIFRVDSSLCARKISVFHNFVTEQRGGILGQLASAPAGCQRGPAGYPPDSFPDCDRLGRQLGEIEEEPASVSTNFHDLQLKVPGRGSGEFGIR